MKVYKDSLGKPTAGIGHLLKPGEEKLPITEEQIQNIAVISRLHRGNRKAFVELVDDYYNRGFARLTESRPNLDAVSKKVIGFLHARHG